MILFIFPPNFAHLLPHFLRTAHLDNFELNDTQSILKSDLQAPRSFFLTLPTRISQIFGSLPLLSLVLVESAMRNGDFMMYHEQKQRIMDIFTWRKEKLFCFCYRLSKTLQESSVQCPKLPNLSRIIGFVKICVPNYIMSQSIWVVLCFLQCLVLCSKSHSVSDIVTNRAICRLCQSLLKMKTNKGLIYFFVPKKCLQFFRRTRIC